MQLLTIFSTSVAMSARLHVSSMPFALPLDVCGCRTVGLDRRMLEGPHTPLNSREADSRALRLTRNKYQNRETPCSVTSCPELLGRALWKPAISVPEANVALHRPPTELDTLSRDGSARRVHRRREMVQSSISGRSNAFRRPPCASPSTASRTRKTGWAALWHNVKQVTRNCNNTTFSSNNCVKLSVIMTITRAERHFSRRQRRQYCQQNSAVRRGASSDFGSAALSSRLHCRTGSTIPTVISANLLPNIWISRAVLQAFDDHIQRDIYENQHDANPLSTDKMLSN